MPTRNVNLTDHFDRFIEAGISSGRFSNASEVVREGLRLLEQREQEDRAKLEWLRGAAKEGFDQIDRGEGIEFESRDDLEAYIHQIGEEVSDIGRILHDSRDLQRHLPEEYRRVR